MNKKLYLDSSSITNNTFKLDEPIIGKWKLLSFTATNNLYNVNDTNNKIYLNESGIDYIIILNDGYFDISDLKDEITSEMNSIISGTISITNDTNTNKFSFTNTLNFYFTFGTNTENSARILLGINESDNDNDTIQVSDVPIDINTCKNIFIDISDNLNKLIVGTSYFNASLVINGLGTFGEILRYIDKDNFDQYINVKNTKEIKITIHDKNNNDIELNSDYSIIFEKC
jgi:hypothetical protein